MLAVLSCTEWESTAMSLSEHIFMGKRANEDL